MIFDFDVEDVDVYLSFICCKKLIIKNVKLFIYE
jgi:hypothetical protein